MENVLLTAIIASFVKTFVMIIWQIDVKLYLANFFIKMIRPDSRIHHLIPENATKIYSLN